MPDDQGRPYVYLAGPDVFYPDAHSRAKAMKEALAARGIVGWFPLDTVLQAESYPDNKRYALAIARACEAMMLEADMGIFNIQPWRGPEADDGTAYEMGFMAALGKPIILHTSDPRPFGERVIADVYRGEVYEDGPFRRGKSDGMMIEEFAGFADNLMLINAAVKSAEIVFGPNVDPASVVQHSFEAAADLAKKLWEAKQLSSSNNPS